MAAFRLYTITTLLLAALLPTSCRWSYERLLPEGVEVDSGTGGAQAAGSSGAPSESGGSSSAGAPGSGGSGSGGAPGMGGAGLAGAPGAGGGGPTCTELGGVQCAPGEVCLHSPLDAAEAEICCTSGECRGQTESLIAEAALATSAVLVDGDVSDWTGVTRWPLTKVAEGTISSSADLSAAFAIQWDSTALYVLVEVTDDVFRVADSGSAPQDDTAELYFDLDASNPTPAYDADEDWGWVLQNSSTPRLDSWTVTAVFSSDASNAWWVEASVDWASAGVTPVAGHTIGFDVSVNDDDGPNVGAGRQGQLTWSDGSGLLFNDATLFGLIRLGEDDSPSTLPVCGDGTCDPATEYATNCPADCP